MAASMKISHRDTVCLLCHGDFIKVPKLLPCFHSFCKECLQPKVDCLNVGDKLSCPHCGMKTTVPSGGIDGIQDDFLQEINLKLSEIHNVKTPFCNVCESIDEKILAFHYCVNCQYYLCNRDKQIHKATPSQKNHCVISYEEMKSGLYDTEIVSSKLGNCPKHSSEATTQRLSFYCEKCEVLACQECFLITHQGHSIKSLSEVSGNHEKLINDLIDKVKQSKQSKVGAITKTETELDTLRKNSDQQASEIRDRGDRLSAMIDKLVEETVEKVKEKFSSEEHKKKEVMNALINQASCSENVKGFIERFLMLTSDVLTINHYQTIAANMDSCFKYLKPLQSVPMKSFKFQHMAETESSNQLKQLFGEIKDVQGSDIEKSSKVMNYFSENTVSLDIKQPGYNNKINFTIINSWSTSHSPDIEISDNGNIYTIFGSDIQIRENNGQLLKVISTETSFSHWNVGLCSSKVFVTNRDSPAIIFRCDIASTDIDKKQLSTNGIVGLAIDQITKDIFISYKDGIFRGNVENMEFSLFSKNNDNKKLLSHPSYMCITRDHRLVVSNWMSNTVNCYDKKGSLLWIYGGKALLNAPRGVCSDTKGHIFVADSRSNRIQLINEDGHFLQYVATSKAINNPCGLAFKDGYLYVTTQNPGLIIKLMVH